MGLTTVLQRLLTLTAAIWHNHNDRPEEAALPRSPRPRVTPRNYTSGNLGPNGPNAEVALAPTWWYG